MSKSYKQTRKKEEEVTISEEGLSKKEQYDLAKQKKQALKEKQVRKNKNKKKDKKKKHYQTNLPARIFAVVMLILTIGSIAASVASYLG